MNCNRLIMTPTSKPIVFFGTEDFSDVALNQLLAAGFAVRLVVTKPDTRRGRGKQLVAPRVKQTALAHDIPVLQPRQLADITPHIQALGQPVGVLVSYGRIIPQRIIDLFSPGIINLHPSLLPAYRGPTPIEQAILDGLPATGISIMSLTAQMDAGPVYSQLTHPLTGTETQPELYDTLARIGSQELTRVLPAIMRGELTPQPQDDTQASYTQLLTKAAGTLDPTQHSAQQLERATRAYYSYPKVRLPFYGQQRIITRAHTATEPSPCTIACLGGTWLAVDELVAPSGRRMSVADFLRGHRP